LNFNLSLKKLLVNNQNYGPGVLKLNIKNVDANAIAEINKKGMGIIESGGSSDLNALSLFFDLPKLLTLGPEIEVPEVNLNLPEGQIIGNFKVSLVKGEYLDPSQIIQNTKGEGQLRAPIDVIKPLMLSAIKDKLQKQTPAVVPQETTQGAPQGTDTSTIPTVTTAPEPVDVDAEAQKQLDALLKNLIDKGYLKVDGKDYIIQFSLENQKLKLNGQPFEPNAFQ
jgi:uncharacterized protein YdgA (DUF945 family)